MDIEYEKYDWSIYLFDNTATQSRRDQELSDNENFLVNHINDTNILLTKDNYKEIWSIQKPSIVFFTINPCDGYWEGKDREMFRLELSNEFRKILRYYKTRKQLPLLAELRFEETGRVHSHGEIHGFPVSYQGYGGELLYISRRLHKVFGKPRLNSNICADFRWTNDKWTGQYCVKNQVMRPIRVSFL